MRLDYGTLIGLVAALGGIGWGLTLEGGSLYEMLQPTAGLIVFGGTAGATLIAQPLSTVWAGLLGSVTLWLDRPPNAAKDVQLIVRLATLARQKGILAIEPTVKELENPFLKKLLTMGVDGVDVREIRTLTELRIEREAAESEAAAGALDTAGGFAPTVGIIGAVLGLIQVMKHLDNIEEVGAGIAVAFVATLYGVGLANLWLLPAAKKLRGRADREETFKRMQLEGAVQLIEGRNPRLIRDRMQAYVGLGDPTPEARQPAASPPEPSPAESV